MGTHRKLVIAVSASNGENVTGLMSIAVFNNCDDHRGPVSSRSRYTHIQTRINGLPYIIQTTLQTTTSVVWCLYFHSFMYMLTTPTPYPDPWCTTTAARS